MTGLEKVVRDSATIKATAEKAEGLIKGLFGKAFDEVGEMIADQVRLRRFKNQIKIFQKATDFLKDKQINSEKINLKVLAPLVEFSSYEEDENLQQLWAKLIKNIIVKPTPIALQQNCIEILNKISNEEAELLSYLFDELNRKREARAKSESNFIMLKPERKPEEYRIDWFKFKIKDLVQSLDIPTEELEMRISNLVALGTVRFETEVDVVSARQESSFEEEVEIELDVYDFETIRLTKLGYKFVQMCKE